MKMMDEIIAFKCLPKVTYIYKFLICPNDVLQLLITNVHTGKND
jgi:hypothetical protein